MDSDLARKRKLSISGRPSHHSSDAHNAGQASYYASSNPPSALPSLANFVSSVNAGALSQPNPESTSQPSRPVKKKRPNGGDDDEVEAARPRVSGSTPVNSETRLPPFPATAMFPVRRAESNLTVVTSGPVQSEQEQDNEEDSDKEEGRQPLKTPGNRGRSESKARNLPAGGKAKAGDDDDADRGYSVGPSNRGGREGSVSFGSGTDAGASGKKGKRNRVHFSCVEVRSGVLVKRSLSDLFRTA